MQLHPDHTSSLKAFSTSLQKVAKVTAQDLILNRQAEARVKSLERSTDPYAPHRAFAKGMGVSFLIPLALDIGTNDPPSKWLQEVQSRGASQYNEHYIDLGLQEGGMNKLESPALAKNIVSRNRHNTVLMPGRQLRNVINVNLVKEVGSGFKDPLFSSGYKKGWQYTPTNDDTINSIHKGLASASKIDESGTKQLMRGIENTFYRNHPEKVNKTRAHFRRYFVDPTAEDISNTLYPNLENMSSLEAIDFERLREAGSRREKRMKLKPFDLRKFQKGLLKSKIKSKMKVPLTLGILGGISAIANNKNERQKYKELMAEVRRRNGRA